MYYQSKCQKILEQIVDLAKPRRVLLFGSAARGQRPPADFDFLIIIDNHRDPRSTAHLLYRKIQRQGIGLDLLVVTENEFEEQRENFWSVLSAAAREGQEIYVA